MTSKRTHTTIKKALVLTILVSLFSGAPQAQTLNRKSGIPQSLLNKVLKKEFQKPVKKVETQEESLPFNLAILESQFASWGVQPSNTRSSINLLTAWKTYNKKKEIVVAVIDTGIDPKHPFLKRNLHTISGISSEKNYGKDFSKGSKNQNEPFDDHGHGTHVSGIIKSVHPDVKLLALKYYNRNASGQDNLNSTIEALRYAVENNVDIINYSGGGPEPALEELKILKEAERKGILIVAAAGNEESNIDVKANAYYPASYGLKNIITVTAHNKSLQMLRSSNWGKKSVDISAPGYNIKSALPGLRAGTLTGTSQATAFVSGSAALIMSQYPELSVEEVKEVIKQSAKKEVTLTSKCSSGGRLDAGKAQIFASQYLKAKKTRSLAAKREVALAKRKKKGQRTVAAAKRRTAKNKVQKVRRYQKPGKIIYRRKAQN